MDSFLKCCFSIFLFWPPHVHPDANMSNDCLFVELKEVLNYAIFLQKIDELCLCLDVVLRNKTPVNYRPSGVFTICLPTDSHFLLIKANTVLILTVLVLPKSLIIVPRAPENLDSNLKYFSETLHTVGYISNNQSKKKNKQTLS